MVQQRQRSPFKPKKNNKFVGLFASLLAGVAVAFISNWAKADVLFEGYSKIISGGVHVGYIVNRYDFDNKKKQFVSTYFLKTNELAGNLTESLQAYADDKMKPISYKYTTLIGNQVKTIDAKFVKDKIEATVNDAGKSKKITKDLPKGVFLSTFLAYQMMKSQTGIKQGVSFEYNAIAEEDAGVEKGFAAVAAVEDFNGIKAFRIVNEFKKSKFISLLGERGDVFATRSPAQQISTELVAQPSLATANFPVPTAVLKQLFGDVPTGQTNEVSKKAQTGSPIKATETVAPGKTQGIPGGQGLQLKGGQAPAAEPGK